MSRTNRTHDDDLDREVLALALDLHDEAARAAHTHDHRRARREAAAELGVAPEHVARAEALVAQRRRSAAAPVRRDPIPPAVVIPVALAALVGPVVAIGFGLFTPDDDAHEVPPIAASATPDERAADPVARPEPDVQLEMRGRLTVNLFDLGDMRWDFALSFD